MSAAVSSQQRYTRSHRCPICGGCGDDPRGKDKRCFGYLSHDGWFRCTREEHAGGIDAGTDGAYSHRPSGPCKCGQTHGADSRTRVKDEPERVYSYTDERGALLFQVVRKPGKKFLQRVPDGAGGWIWKLNGTRRVPYRLRDLIEDDADRTVFIAEGEKDVDALFARGFLATCNPGGAGKWSLIASDARTLLADRDVVVVADRDDVGIRHAREVEASLRDVARSIRVVVAQAPHKDVSDVLLAGGSTNDLVALESAVESSAPAAVEAAPRPYVLESASELAEPLPPLEWLCKGLKLARGSLTMVGGYGYSRKTMYAQELALSVATGKDALGVYGVKHAPVVHIDYEQGRRITRERYQRMARAANVELRSALLWTVTFPVFRLNDAAARDVLRRLLEESKAALVIVDSLRAAIPGVDENSSEVRAYLDLLGEEVKRVEAAAVVIHHARKPSEGNKVGGRYSLRGSSAIFDACDSVFVFSGEKGQPTTAEQEKDRFDGNELDAFGLSSEDVERDGDPRWGLRLVHMEAEQLAADATSKQNRAEAKERAERASKIETYLSSLDGRTWKGTRTALAKQVGGKAAVTMAAIGDLVSTGRLAELVVGRKTEGLQWLSE